jgi:hypothetical protein
VGDFPPPYWANPATNHAFRSALREGSTWIHLQFECERDPHLREWVSLGNLLPLEHWDSPVNNRLALVVPCAGSSRACGRLSTTVLG